MKCLTREKTEAGVEGGREREIRNMEILFSKAIAPFEGL